MTAPGTPTAPNWPADTVAAKLNGTPWPWVVVVDNTSFDSDPGGELSPISRAYYPNGADQSYTFGGSLILPFVGQEPGQLQTLTYVDDILVPSWSSGIPYAITLYAPAYAYGPPHTVALALNVQTAFALDFATQTLGSDGNPISVTHERVDASLISGLLRAHSSGAVDHLAADVDVRLAASSSFTVAPGANPFGTTNLRGETDVLARWISLCFADPDTGEKITVAYDASKGAARSPIAFDSTTTRGYTIADAIATGPFAPQTYGFGEYVFGKREYSVVTDGSPDFSSPYTVIPDVDSLTLNTLISISLTRTIYPAPLIHTPPDAPSLQKSGYTPGLTGAMALPAGGGSPRLLLVSSRTYCDVNVSSVYDAVAATMTRTVTRKYTTSAIRCAASLDLGATFDAGSDLAAQFLDGTDLTDMLAGTDTATETYHYSGGAFTVAAISDPAPWSYAFARAVSLLVAAHGGLFVNGASEPPSLPYGASEATVYRTRQWKGPRVTDDATGRTGWRDCATSNADPASGAVQLNGKGPFWWTRGRWDGVRGAGGKSGGPALMAHANMLTDPLTTAISADCGQTWTAARSASYMPATAGLAHQRGGSFDGIRFSLADFLAGAASVVTGLPAGPRYLQAGADGDTVSVACVDTTGEVTIYTSRTGLSSPVWTARPGPAAVADIGFAVVGFTWQQKCVVALCPAPDVIAVYASADDCGHWQPVCWSADNMASWQLGGYDA